MLDVRSADRDREHRRSVRRRVRHIRHIWCIRHTPECQIVHVAAVVRQKEGWNCFSTVLNSAQVVLEAAARSIDTHEQQVLSGLRPSEKSIIAMIRAARLGDTAGELEQRVHVRMARQSLLTQDDPIDLRVVLDEAALSRPAGGDEVMCDQLLRLIDRRTVSGEGRGAAQVRPHCRDDPGHRP